VMLVAREDGVVRITAGHAVHGLARSTVTGLAVARLGARQERARFAAILGSNDDGTSPGLGAGTTSFGASLEPGKTRDDAINGAGEGVAGGARGESGAASTA
jgi:hypothetical protein